MRTSKKDFNGFTNFYKNKFLLSISKFLRVQRYRYCNATLKIGDFTLLLFDSSSFIENDSASVIVVL